ncbi:MAG: Crp/Fnr family transcriptional regulator [Geminicoccaceae bacterium]|nr:Crp/Fnr family transcriptional regulator [Geminicoccaceae bacterium]
MERLDKRETVCCGASVACESCAVRPLAVCGALPTDALARLARMTHPRRLGPGATLIEEGEPALDVFTVVEGMLKLYKLMPDGRRQITGFMIPGDFVGLSVGEAYIYSAEAVMPTTACRFRRNFFHGMMEDYPDLETRLLGIVSTELAAAQGQMLLLGRKTAKERLASFLLSLAGRLEVAAGDRLALPMTRSDIADFLGLTIETVSRTFTVLRKEGLLARVDKAGVVVADIDALARAAGD